MVTERVLQDFAGRWRLEKEIAAAGQPPARFEGVAEWRGGAGGLRYEERGQLWLGAGAPMQAARRYLWTPALEVFFEDGRFFHRVPAAGGEAHHHCAPDAYRVAYRFDNWPEFTAVWRVTGPRKDYVMTARYTR